MKPREDRKRKPTKTALIDVAEEFFATHGLKGSSLREIAAAAGQRNYNAVQYHFGTKRGLINAVLNVRYREVDQIRGKIVSPQEVRVAITGLGVRELLKLIWEPVYILASRPGRNSFPRFELQYRLASREADHPFYQMDQKFVPIEALAPDQASPVMYEVARALRQRFPRLDDTEFHRRTSTISYMFLCFLIDREDTRTSGRGSSFEADFDLILEMMTAALSAGQ